jgi:hypothetical protein
MGNGTHQYGPSRVDLKLHLVRGMMHVGQQWTMRWNLHAATGKSFAGIVIDQLG